ncbi:hypothetical protein JHK85_029920 [Glycine max]|nr:hypothetical protein JHK85_029920 [Glycine max]
MAGRGGAIRDANNRSKRSDGVVPAVLWFQGESHAIHEEDAAAYKFNMETLIHNLRQDLNSPSSFTASGSDHTEKVREAQKVIDLPNVICVDAKGLQLKEDNLHLIGSQAG